MKVENEGSGILDIQRSLAEMPIEEMNDIDELRTALGNARDMVSRFEETMDSAVHALKGKRP